MKILLAEDDKFQQIVVKHVIEALGHTIDIVDNGKLVLEQIIHHTYDLILMDINMPVMDGYEASKHVKEVEASLPIIGMTSQMKDDRLNQVESNFLMIIEKPVNKEKLYKAFLKFNEG
jgi:CheY-like chemotaxis protein